MPGPFVRPFYTSFLQQSTNPVSIQPPDFWLHAAVSFSYYSLLTALHPEAFWSLLLGLLLTHWRPSWAVCPAVEVSWGACCSTTDSF